MAWVIDYANSRPDLNAAKGSGCESIARYIGTAGASTSKNITQSEVDTLKSLGMGLVLVLEDDGGVYGGGPAQGWNRGLYDAQIAMQQADVIGFPKDKPLYFAVDTDGLNWGTVLEYFKAVKSILDRPVGGYGQPQLMESLKNSGVISYLWCTAAWSGGYRSPSANLFQRIGTTYSNLNSDYDENDIIQADYGQWYPAGGSQSSGGFGTMDDATILRLFKNVLDDIGGTNTNVNKVISIIGTQVLPGFDAVNRGTLSAIKILSDADSKVSDDIGKLIQSGLDKYIAELAQLKAASNAV